MLGNLGRRGGEFPRIPIEKIIGRFVRNPKGDPPFEQKIEEANRRKKLGPTKVSPEYQKDRRTDQENPIEKRDHASPPAMTRAALPERSPLERDSMSVCPLVFLHLHALPGLPRTSLLEKKWKLDLIISPYAHTRRHLLRRTNRRLRSAPCWARIRSVR